MGRYILAIVFSLGLSTFSFAQGQDSLQTQEGAQQDDMVCFLTDANTITCFVAPENMPKEGQEGNTEDNLYDNQRPEDDVLNDGDDMLEGDGQQFEGQEEGAQEDSLYRNEEEDYESTEVKMI